MTSARSRRPGHRGGREGTTRDDADRHT